MGWISLVLILSLWLGALAIYAVVKAIGAGLLTSSEPTAVLIGDLDEATVAATLGVVLKHASDHARAVKELRLASR